MFVFIAWFLLGMLIGVASTVVLSIVFMAGDERGDPL